MTLEQFKKACEEYAKAATEVLDAQRAVAQSKQEVARAHNEIESCKRHCDSIKNDVVACEKHMAQVRANADAYAKDVEEKANAKVQRIMDEGMKELNKVKGKVSEAKQKLEANLQAITETSDELAVLRTQLAEARGRVNQLLGAAR